MLKPNKHVLLVLIALVFVSAINNYAYGQTPTPTPTVTPTPTWTPTPTPTPEFFDETFTRKFTRGQFFQIDVRDTLRGHGDIYAVTGMHSLILSSTETVPVPTLTSATEPAWIPEGALIFGITDPVSVTQSVWLYRDEENWMPFGGGVINVDNSTNITNATTINQATPTNIYVNVYDQDLHVVHIEVDPRTNMISYDHSEVLAATEGIEFVMYSQIGATQIETHLWNLKGLHEDFWRKTIVQTKPQRYMDWKVGQDGIIWLQVGTAQTAPWEYWPWWGDGYRLSIGYAYELEQSQFPGRGHQAALGQRLRWHFF